MSSKTEFRLGIIGLGGISDAHGPAIKRSRAGIRIAACCDIRPEAVKRWEEDYDAVGYTDYAAMVRKEKLDGVLLATWPNQHREQLEQLLAAGVKNILCEKALTLTGREAAEIHKLVSSAGAFVMEGFMYRHNPVIRKLEQILARGEVGPVDNVRACFSAFDPETADPSDPNRNWRQRKECGGGIPYDFACYCVNCCGHFAGDLPRRVYAIGNTGKYDTINRIYGTIEYANGVVGIIESSKKCSYTQEVQISCAGGILNVPIAWTIPHNLTITQRHTGWNAIACDSYPTDNVPDWLTSYQLQAENFAGVVRGQAKPLIPLAQSVVNTFALEALVTSILVKRVVEIRIPQNIQQAYASARKEIGT
jgi:predicted dehydrogenase